MEPIAGQGRSDSKEDCSASPSLGATGTETTAPEGGMHRSQLEHIARRAVATSQSEAAAILQQLITAASSDAADTDWHLFVKHTWLPVLSLAYGQDDDWRLNFDSDSSAMLALHSSILQPFRKPIVRPAGSPVSGPASLPVQTPPQTRAPWQATGGGASISPVPIPITASSPPPIIHSEDGAPPRAFTVEAVDIDGKRRRLRRKRAASPTEENDAALGACGIGGRALSPVAAAGAPNPKPSKPAQADAQVGGQRGGTASLSAATGASSSAPTPSLDPGNAAILISRLISELSGLSIDTSRGDSRRRSASESTLAEATTPAPSSTPWEGLLDCLKVIHEVSERHISFLKPLLSVFENLASGAPPKGETSETKQQFSQALLGSLHRIVGETLGDRRDMLGRTALHVAVMSGNHELVESLVAAGCDVNKPLPLDIRILQAYDPSSKTETIRKNNAITAAKAQDVPPMEPPAWWTDHGKLTTGIKIPPPAPVGLQGATPLHCAAAVGDTASLERLLRAVDVDVNALTAAGDAAIHLAAYGGHASAVASLCSAPGVDINVGNASGATALHMAAAMGHAGVVEVLWARGARIDPSDTYGWRPLHYAARGGHANVASSLIIAGSQVQAYDADGVTAAHLAAERGHTLIVEKLLMAGFIPEAAAAPYSPDGNGTTAMHVAAAQGHSDTLAAFIHVSPAGCNVKDALGFTALDAALNHGQFHLPPMLIAAGCTMRLPDSSGSGSGSGDVPSKVGTRAMKADDHDGRRHAEPSDENVTESLPLGVPSAEVTRCLEILAASDPIKDARFASIPPDLPVFRDILGNDVSFFSCCAAAGHLSALNALRRQQGDDCMAHELPNAMLLAVRAGHAEVVRWLAADPRCSPEACKEHALLHQAAALGCNETLKALLEGGWDPSEVHGGTTPLQEAVRYGNLCSTETLLQATRELQNSKQILNHMDVRGWTAVHAAAASGDVKMLRALLDAGASPSVSLATVANSSQRERGKLGGVMAIHLAAKEGRLAAMHQLLEAGCDPTLADARGWTTLHYVAQRGDFASFALLNGNGASAGLLSSASPQSAASLLTASVLGGSEEIVKAVLSAGMAAPEACVAAGETPVHAAACEGFVRALIYLRDAGFDLCSKDTEGRSPLHQVPTGYGHAARAGLRHNDFIAAAELLLDAGCEVNAADSHGCTPLHIAAGCGSSEMLDRFLKLASSQETKARCNVPDEIGWTPLFWAASEGHEFSVALLLAAGADPCATDCNHRIPLHFAAEGGHLPCVRALLSDMQQRTKATAADLHVPDQNGQTPLMLAAEAGHVDVVAALLDAAPTNDAPAGEAESKRRNALHLLAQQGQEDILQHVLEARRLHPSAKDADGWAPLHHAAVAGHVVVTALLLAAGAEVDDSASDGDVPLHKAALGGHLDVVDALLQARATVDARNASGSTPLYNAASQGHCDVVACLLEAGAAPDATTSNGCSPLYIAANNGWQEAVALLLSYDADPNLQATGGCGPLHAAAMNGHAGVVESLLEHHACDADLQSSNGSTPLHNAAASGHVAAVNALLAGNADTDVENTAGNTPLHMAAGKGWVDVVDRLVEAGADLAVKNQKNLTPVQSAASSGYFEAVLKLVQQGSPWKQKGDGDVVRLLSRKTTLKLSYIEGRLRLAEKERQRRLAKAGNGGRTPHGGAGLGGEIAGHAERSEEDLKAAQAQADAAMAALLQEEQAEKAKAARQRAKKEAKKQKKAAQRAAEDVKPGSIAGSAANAGHEDVDGPSNMDSEPEGEEGASIVDEEVVVPRALRKPQSQQQHADATAAASLGSIPQPATKRMGNGTAASPSPKSRNKPFVHSTTASPSPPPHKTQQSHSPHQRNTRSASTPHMPSHPAKHRGSPPPPPPPPPRAASESLASAPAMPVPTGALKPQRPTTKAERVAAELTHHRHHHHHQHAEAPPQGPAWRGVRPTGPYAAALAGQPRAAAQGAPVPRPSPGPGLATKPPLSTTRHQQGSTTSPPPPPPAAGAAQVPARQQQHPPSQAQMDAPAPQQGGGEALQPGPPAGRPAPLSYAAPHVQTTRHEGTRPQSDAPLPTLRYQTVRPAHMTAANPAQQPIQTPAAHYFGRPPLVPAPYQPAHNIQSLIPGGPTFVHHHQGGNVDLAGGQGYPAFFGAGLDVHLNTPLNNGNSVHSSQQWGGDSLAAPPRYYEMHRQQQPSSLFLGGAAERAQLYGSPSTLEPAMHGAGHRLDNFLMPLSASTSGPAEGIARTSEPPPGFGAAAPPADADGIDDVLRLQPWLHE